MFITPGYPAMLNPGILTCYRKTGEKLELWMRESASDDTRQGMQTRCQGATGATTHHNVSSSPPSGYGESHDGDPVRRPMRYVPVYPSSRVPVFVMFANLVVNITYGMLMCFQGNCG